MPIKPYFQKGNITIYHGDFRELALESLATASIDLILADPPYGETSLKWDRWPKGWLSALEACAKPNASLWCFGTLRMFFEHLPDFKDWRFVQDVIWEKHNGSGFLVDRFRRVHETISHFVPVGAKWADVYKNPQFTMDATKRTVRKKAKPAQWQGATGPTLYVSKDGGPRLMRSVQYHRSLHGRSLHPTQKPISILCPIIEYSCPPGGTILDPFAGSGSTLLAAKQLHRAAIGFEIDESYCEKAATRLSENTLF